MKTGTLKQISLSVLLLGMSACSMKDRTEVHSVSFDLPKSWVGASSSSSMNILNHGASSMLVANPNNFACFALNVKGPGIQSDPRMGCTDPNSGMGILAGFVPLSSGTIDMMVPAGASRTVQLIGISSTIGCPLLNDLLNAGGPDALHAMGEPYLLGSSTVDIFDDTAVTINASLSSTNKAFSSCGNHNDDSNTPDLQLQISGNTTAVQTGNCVQLNLNIHGSTAIAPSTVGLASSSVNAHFYSENTCTSAAVSSIAFPNGNYASVWMKTSDTSGSFTVIAKAMDNTSAVMSNWQTHSVSLNPVPQRLSVANGGGQFGMNICYPLTLSRLDNTSTSVTFGSNVDATPYLFGFMTNNNGNGNPPAPSVKVYNTGPDCSSNLNSIASASNPNGGIYFPISFAASQSTQTIYVKDSASENLSATFYTSDNSVQASSTNTSFTPWSYLNLSQNMGSSLGGGQFVMSFSGTGSGAPAVTGILIGTAPCTNFNNVMSTNQNVTCIVPSGLGNQPVYAQTSTGTFSTGMMYMYLPGVVPGQIFNLTQNTAVAGTSINFANGTASNCTVSPSLPSGLSLSSSCLLSGTPTALTSGQNIYTISTNATQVGQIVLSVATTGTTTLSGVSGVFYSAGCTNTGGCSYLSQVYTFTVGQPVVLYPSGSITGPIPSNCTISPALPVGSGLTLMPNCSLMGTPNMADYNGISGTTLATSYTIASLASNVSVQFSVIAPPIMAPGSIYVAEGNMVTPNVTGGIPPYTFSITSGGGSFSGGTYTAPTGVAASYAMVSVNDSQIGPHAHSPATFQINYGLAPVIAANQVINMVNLVSGSPILQISNMISSCSGSGLPSGVTLSGVSMCMFGGIPTATGTYTIPVTAANNYGTGSGSVTLNVIAAPVSVPAVTSSQTFSFSRGVAINSPIALTGGAPTTCSCSGSLPAGLLVSNTCQFVGEIDATVVGGSTTCSVNAYNPVGGSSAVNVNISW